MKADTLTEYMTKTRTHRVRCKVLAVSSAGGHWVQLLRLRGAFEGENVTYVTTNPSYKSMVDGASFRTVTDAHRNSKLKMILLVCQMLWILLRERPTSIITTGAAPGYIAIRLGKWFGAKTLWIDSIANAEELSMSGRLAIRHANTVLTQWNHIAREGQVEYRGAVI